MEKINGNHIHDDEPPEVIYVYDALCGWCYGFSPVIMQLRKEFSDKVDFLVLSGGMVRGKDVVPVSHMADFLKDAHKVVERTCGVEFGEKFISDILQKGEAMLNSVPPSKALAAFRLEMPEKDIDFASRIQKAIYYDGIHSDDTHAYGRLAAEFDLNQDEFIKSMNSDAIAEIVENEFKMVESMGVKGFPTLLLKKGKQIDVLVRGYKDYDTVARLLQNALSQ